MRKSRPLGTPRVVRRQQADRPPSGTRNLASGRVQTTARQSLRTEKHPGRAGVGADPRSSPPAPPPGRPGKPRPSPEQRAPLRSSDSYPGSAAKRLRKASSQGSSPLRTHSAAAAGPPLGVAPRGTQNRVPAEQAWDPMGPDAIWGPKRGWYGLPYRASGNL